MLNILHMTTAAVQEVPGVEIRGAMRPEFHRVLTPEAIQFVALLHREFNPRREELLARRERVKRELDRGKLPDFLSATREIREGATS